MRFLFIVDTGRVYYVSAKHDSMAQEHAPSKSASGDVDRWAGPKTGLAGRDLLLHDIDSLPTVGQRRGWRIPVETI